MVEQAPNPADDPQPPAHRRQGTMKMATLAFQNLNSMQTEAYRKGNSKDFVSELMLPISCVLLIAAIVFSGEPMVKAVAFVLPLLAFAYYLYRRIGVLATFEPRQAFLAWRLLIATFLFGGTFALFTVYVLAYVSQMLMHRTP
ncbi:MAG TPA: hypothetical protein V6D22_08165 [Candidatus Obscuribacterales bacterium]